jgi:hypothetical protein
MHARIHTRKHAHAGLTSGLRAEAMAAMTVKCFLGCDAVHFRRNFIKYSHQTGRWLGHCATSRRVSGSIPSGDAGEFFRSYRWNHVLWGGLSF